MIRCMCLQCINVQVAGGNQNNLFVIVVGVLSIAAVSAYLHLFFSKRLIIKTFLISLTVCILLVEEKKQIILFDSLTMEQLSQQG